MEVDRRNMWLGIVVVAFFIWVLLTSICAVSSWVTNKSELPQVGTAIGTQNTFTITRKDHPEFWEEWSVPAQVYEKPEYFIKITSSDYFDISEMFVNDRLKVIVDDKYYWIKLEEDINYRFKGTPTEMRVSP